LPMGGNDSRRVTSCPLVARQPRRSAAASSFLDLSRPDFSASPAEPAGDFVLFLREPICGFQNISVHSLGLKLNFTLFEVVDHCAPARMGRVTLRCLLGPLLLLSIALSQDCSASEFACSGALTNTIAPSWCSSSNPLIVARPPSALSEGSELGGAPFYCPHGDGLPFEQCFLVRLGGYKTGARSVKR